MRIDDIGQIQNTYRHIYLSPHMDDAALSCGGAIISRLAAGERVLVVTLTTAAPPPEGPFNAVAREFHADWGLEAADVVGIRLGEERLAMERLGCHYYLADLLDAIYRVPEAYMSRDTLFAPPVPYDPLHADLRALLARLRAQAPSAVFYAPLGVGDHVDHLLTFDAAIEAAGAPLAFYEDVHYVLVPGVLDRRLAAIGRPMAPSVTPVDAAIEGKIAAIAAYGSQVPELFGGFPEMAAKIRAYAASLAPEGRGLYERTWSLAR